PQGPVCVLEAPAIPAVAAVAPSALDPSAPDMTGAEPAAPASCGAAAVIICVSVLRGTLRAALPPAPVPAARSRALPPLPLAPAVPLGCMGSTAVLPAAPPCKPEAASTPGSRSSTDVHANRPSAVANPAAQLGSKQRAAGEAWSPATRDDPR